MERRPLCLSFGPGIAPTAKGRITYALNAFCAVYGYDLTSDDEAQSLYDHPRICYGRPSSRNRDVVIPALYVERQPTVPLHAPTWVQLEEASTYSKLGLASAPCFHSSQGVRQVDWLGEIFEWLSCADEYAIKKRDDVGRIPFSACVHGRFDIDPTIPYAAVAMYELNRSIRRVVGETWPDRPLKPWTGPEQVIATPSHDLDYLPTSMLDNFHRLAKNMAIAALQYHDAALTGSIGGAALRGLVIGKSPLDCVEEMCRREVAAGVSSTSNVIARHGHSRDANYELEDPRVARALRQIADHGMEIGLHGSYTSLADGTLELELERLAHAGYQPVGVRQHWLRYTADNLFEEVARLGLLYDSTVGFAERVGFRAGASFPYAPYDFRRERAYPFIEIPLALMDVALYQQVRGGGGNAHALCTRVLDATEAFGWGGIAILWHNTVFRGAQIPLELGNLYWELKRPSHKWVTSKELAQLAVAPPRRPLPPRVPERM